MLPAFAQQQAALLVTHPIDESTLVTLHGTVHPLAQPNNDRGAVADSFPAPRMLLLLNRPPDRDAALQQFLQAAHTRGSASYHQWLTPDQFGAQFGAADADIATASAWLTAHGLAVARTSKSRQFIEFSGTAGALRQAFHTEIHRYEVNGESHYANASELKIPAALAGLIKGVSPLNDFSAQPQLQILGEGVLARGHRATTPQWTSPNQYGTSNPYEFTVAPEDFETQYDLAPLYQSGVNGSGETIGIVNESNIDLSLVQNFQKLFGTGGQTPQVIIDGDDPGNLEGVDVEAYLDVEVSGAVAPKATVDLYIASAGNLIDPLELAALRAVEDNQASVLSVSFGQCEYFLGSAGNQFWSSLWEQAAAQGQTVLVASGDSGSECAGEFWVSGLTSTPWNVSVGGTDFYYSDYASGGASANSLWNTTNDANLGSLKAPLEEQPWNDAFGLDLIANGIQRGEVGAGGGGVSNCVTQNATANLSDPCTGGYPKPSWQSGPNVPSDGARDLPDVSLFASNGANLSAWAICAFEGECASGSGASVQVELVGGTSASAPAMAGIMALVNQKYGRQGQADYTLYALAQQKPSAFHDVTLGSISVPCGGQISADCVLQANGNNGTPQYPAGSGYDLASGLGSVDADLLVTDWNAITYQPTTTTLKLSSASIVHGGSVTVTASVAPSSGSGTPTGDVAILTNADLPASQSQLFVTLAKGTGSGTANYLPGGDYQLTGRYAGDGTYATSTSQPVSLTVTPESSNINFSMTSGAGNIAAGSSIGYDSPFQLNIHPAGASQLPGQSDGNATGTATFTVDSTAQSVALNATGVAAWAPPALAVGSHTASAAYSGDASFKASTAAAVNFSVTKGEPFVNLYILNPESTMAPGYNIQPGGSVTVSGMVGPEQGVLAGVAAPNGTAAPSGTVTFCLTTNLNIAVQACTNPTYAQTVTLAPPSGMYSLYATATATFSNLAAGDYQPEFVYNGDTNWEVFGIDYITTIAVQPFTPLAASSISLNIAPDSISGTQVAQLTTTVTGSAAAAPTGEVFYYDNDIFLGYDILLPGTTGAISTDSFGLDAASFWNSGANQLTAVYLGDGTYAPSTSNALSVTATQTAIGDFSLAPQAPLITVQPGSTGTLAVNLASVSGFNGSVALTCSPSSNQFTCSIAPGSLTVNGAATATVTVSATLPASAQALPLNPVPGQRPPRWPAAAATLALCLLFLGRRPFMGRRWDARLRSVLLALALPFALLAAFAFTGCGGTSTTGKTNPPPDSTPAGTYTIVVTGTASGIVHNAVITVVVP
jgi:subtilase family serine protease